MNKKYIALLIPLLLMPLIAIGYAHFTDQVVKKYKLHVGSVFLNITGFHLNEARMPDVDNDGVIFGDELKVNIYDDPATSIWYEEITADPMTGGFILNTTTWLHNSGKLPFELRWEVFWSGPFDTDPCFDPPGPTLPLSTLASPPWHYSMVLYKWHLNPATNVYERSGPFAPTQTHYKPCDYIEVIQVVEFDQPDPTNAPSMLWQKEWQCHWIRLWVTFTAQDVTSTISSNTVPGLPANPLP